MEVRKRSRGKKINHIHFELDAKLDAQVERYSDETGISKRRIIEKALRELLRANGVLVK